MKNNLKRKSGFTLVEILLVTGFIALASTGIYTAYSKAKIYYEITAEVRNLDELRKVVINYGQTNNSYSGTTNSLLISMNLVPHYMLGNPAPMPLGTSTILSLNGTAIAVGPASFNSRSNNGFSIIYYNLDTERCIKLHEMGAKYFSNIVVNGTFTKNTNLLEQTSVLNTVINECSSRVDTNFIMFTHLDNGMNSLAATTGSVTPVISSVKPIYSTPFAEEAMNSNPHVAESFKSRHWGVATSSALPNPTVAISATPLSLGYADGPTPVMFNVSQRNVDIVNSALVPWYKSVLAANGGNVPASFYQPTFKNDPQWFLNVVAINTLADLAGASRGAGLPAAMTSEIANFKTFIGPPLF